MSTNRIELVGSWYEFMKTEISKSQYDRYIEHYRLNGTAVDSDDDDWSELRENGEDMGVDGNDAQLLVNDIEVKDLHRLIRQHKNFAYFRDCSYSYERNSYYWVSYDYFKGGSFSIETDRPFEFSKLFFCAQALNPIPSIASPREDSSTFRIITSVSYDDESFIEDGGSEHRYSKEWLIKT